jgi:hypothetical protein
MFKELFTESITDEAILPGQIWEQKVSNYNNPTNTIMKNRKGQNKNKIKIKILSLPIGRDESIDVKDINTGKIYTFSSKYILDNFNKIK